MHALSPPTKSYGEIKATRKMRWWYEHLADVMIAHPTWTQSEIATYLGRGVSTLSLIWNSDAFKAYLRQRRAAYTESLDASVRQKMLMVADQGFDLILDRFEKKKDSIPLDVLQKTVDTSLKALGFGQATAGPAVVINNGQTNNTAVVAVSLEDLQNAQTALRNAQASPRPAIEAEFTEVTPSPTDILDDLA